MAEINVQRKEKSMWPWLLGLALLALLVWALFEVFDRDEVAEPVVGAAPVTAVDPLPAPVTDPGAAVTTEGIALADILANPATWTGRTVNGEVRVGEVVSDRGFWIEAQGQRAFMLINEVPGEIKDINTGQSLRINEAMVYSSQDMSKIPGTMDPQAKTIADGQPVVLAADSRNIEILTTAAGAPATPQ